MCKTFLIFLFILLLVAACSGQGSTLSEVTRIFAGTQTVLAKPTQEATASATLEPSPQLALSTPLSTTHYYTQTYKRATFSISFPEVRDLGSRVGGKLNFTEVVSIKPEFQDTHHLVGIFIAVEPPTGRNLILRTGQIVIKNNTTETTHLDYILTPQGARIYPLGFCTPDLDSCNGLGMPFAKLQVVFTQPSQTVRVFAIPNTLQDFTYYTLWDDPDYVK